MLLQFLLVEEHGHSTGDKCVNCVEITREFVTNRWKPKWQGGEAKTDKREKVDGRLERDTQDARKGQNEPDQQRREHEQAEQHEHVQQDRQDVQDRPNLIISILSDKEPLSINQRALKSIVYDLVTAADEAKGKHYCQCCKHVVVRYTRDFLLNAKSFLFS